MKPRKIPRSAGAPFAWGSIGRGLGLLRARTGRVLLVWLLQAGLSLLACLLLGVASVLLLLPLAAVVFAGYSAGQLQGLLTTGAIALVVYILAVVLISGAVGAYFSTYWTLAFRRLELDPLPAAA